MSTTMLLEYRRCQSSLGYSIYSTRTQRRPMTFLMTLVIILGVAVQIEQCISFTPSSIQSRTKKLLIIPGLRTHDTIRSTSVIFSLQARQNYHDDNDDNDIIDHNRISHFNRRKSFKKSLNRQRFKFLIHRPSDSKGRFRQFLKPLFANKKENEENNESVSSSVGKNDIIDYPMKALSNITTSFKIKWDATTDVVVKSLPEPVVKIFTILFDLFKILWNGWTKIRWFLLTFTAGAVLSIAALIVPIQDSVSQLSQPVTLFETILHDLDQAYVEPVDTQKLFETGVSAMLQSLDPYTEFETQTAATALSESIDGRYGGVGLVIAGIPEQQLRAAPKIQQSKTFQTPAALDPKNPADNKLLPTDAINDNVNLDEQQAGADGDLTVSMDSDGNYDEDDDDDELALQDRRRRAEERIRGVRVVSAFEGYAFDYGLRVGDKLLQVDDLPITPTVSIEQVRNKLRGQPGTTVDIAFERDGVPGVQTVTMPRTVVRIRDVKLATLVGNPADGIGYIQLSGFASDAGREVRNAIRYLQQAAEDASNGEQTLQGLVLDLRGNPGGLLTSAVDVASLIVPKGSDIVSAKGRGFPGVIYRSRVDPILDTSKTKLAVLVNGNTASAAEIVSGAIQDLDVGVIVGADRTFGKGLVQNVEELPYNTALKFTVAKYYTPSGRCIQGIKYTEGGGVISDDNDGRYVASKVSEKDRNSFYTRLGRVVKDGGGVEADYKVSSPKASVLEITLLRSGIINEFAAEWSKNHELTHNFQVDEDTYRQFQNFVAEKQKQGDIKLEALYDGPLQELKRVLKKSGYKGSERSVDQLQARIIQDMKNDFDKYRSDIKEDISTSILARYLPESMLIERSIKSDIQVTEAIKLLKSRNKFDTLLAKGNEVDRQSQQQVGLTASTSSTSNSNNVANQGTINSINNDAAPGGFRSSISW